tara:strand:- start:773 stop:1783 length:1011 start_codon:yes stop_codon:yes gene_type:complete
MTTPFLRLTETFPDQIPKEWAPEIFISEVKEALGFKTVPQLMTNSSELFIKNAEKILPFCKQIEINCGCPSPKVIGKGAGSGLLVKPESFGRLLDKITTQIGPNILSVKMRTGFDNDNHYSHLISILGEVALNRIVIHGRTRAQKYTGEACWEKINFASQQTSHNIIGSGDIDSFSSYVKKTQQVERLYGVIIGRGILKNPWLLHEIRQKKQAPLNRKLITHSLYVYCLLVELYSRSWSNFIDLICLGGFKKSLDLNTEEWLFFSERVEEFIMNRLQVKIDDEFFSRLTLGKLKMIWTYFHPKKTDEIFAKKMLRSKTVNEFFLALEKCPFIHRDV